MNGPNSVQPSTALANRDSQVPNDARQVIEEVAEAISQFTYLAQQKGISTTTVSAITKTLEQRKQENAALFL